MSSYHTGSRYGSSVAGCPDPSVLEAFVQGTLDLGARTQLEAHLDGCGECSQTIAELVRLFGSASVGAGVTPSMGSHAAASMVQTNPSQGAAGDPNASHGAVSVGRYQLGARLGAGGMGVVFEAHDPELHRRVAIKLLHPGGTEDAEITRARLLREARAMAQLSHPNVVAVHDVGRVGDQVFLAMELVEGTTLSQWMKQGSRSQEELLAMFVQAGRGLVAAHEVGMVHRDFKPDNVLIGADGRARVTDFGLAQPAAWIDGNAPANSTSGDALKMSVAITTAHGAIVGTPAYMAPEQWKGLPADARSDQFSFCVALYEALFGERPFFGRTWMELSGNVLSARMKPIPRGTPGWLRAALVQGLSVDPTQRHRSMAALLTALSRDRGRALRIGAIAGAMGLGALATVGVLTWMADETVPVTTKAEAASEGPAEGDESGEETGAAKVEQPGSTGTLEEPATDTGVAEDDACIARAAAADGIWTADRRERLIERFHKMERGLAIVSQTMPVLDAWVEAYATEATKLCDPAPDLEHVDARRRCLEGRAARLDALADRMVTHETFSIDESVAGAAYGLPPVERCGNPDWLSAAPDAPDSSISAKAHLLTTDLAAVEADTLLFQVTSAPGDGEHVVEEADALGYRPLLAEAELAMGLLAAERYQTDFAVSWLERAAVSADAADHDEAQVRAALALIEQQGGIMLDPAASKRWVRIASSIADRIDEPRLTAEVKLALAKSQRGTLELVTARDTLKEAITAHETAFGEQNPRLALVHIEASNVAYDLLDAVQAKAHADTAAKILRKTLGPDDLRLCVALTALARAELLAGELEAAGKTIETAVKIPFVSTSLRHDYDKGDALLVQGDIEAARGDREAALKTYEKAEIYHYTGDRKAEPLLRRGALLVEMGKTADGLKVLTSGVAVLESLYDEDDARLVAALRVLGEAQSKAGKHAAARTTLERAVTIADGAVGFGPFTARSKIDLARAERAAGKRKRALELFDDAHVPWVGGYDMKHPKVVEELLARADLAYELGDKKYAGRLYRTNADELAALYGEESDEAKRAVARRTDD